jgi:hypothetical protein
MYMTLRQCSGNNTVEFFVNSRKYLLFIEMPPKKSPCDCPGCNKNRQRARKFYAGHRDQVLQRGRMQRKIAKIALKRNPDIGNESEETESKPTNSDDKQEVKILPPDGQGSEMPDMDPTESN